jgi:parallel beta-helix repeat protein
MATPGETIHVAPGTYGNVMTSVSGTPTQRVRFISDVQWAAHVVGTISANEGIFETLGSYVDVMGFDIAGNSANGLIAYGSFVRLIGNRVHDIVASCDSNGGSGINSESYSASDNEIIGNVVFNVNAAPSCGQVHGIGIYQSNLRGHILNNIAINTGRAGIQLWHAANAVVVANNIVLNNTEVGIVVGAGDSPGGVTCDNTTVVNNIAINNGIYGIQEFGSTGPNNKYLNNLVFGNPSGGLITQTGSASGTILSNPQFVNNTGTAAGDLHLQSTSPAIDSGTTTDAPSIAIDGAKRPAGAGPDIGAYEFNSPPASWPWM